MAERAEADVARPPEALDHVVAGVDAHVLDARSQPSQRGAPWCLATADVEHSADRPFEQVFGRGHGELHLAVEPRFRAEALAAVPTIEVLPVVLLHWTRLWPERPPAERGY